MSLITPFVAFISEAERSLPSQKADFLGVNVGKCEFQTFGIDFHGNH
jgi:hypothetical protein